MPKNLFKEFEDLSLEGFKESSKNLFLKSLIDNMSSLDQKSAYFPQPPKKMDLNRRRWKEPLPISINL